MAKYLIGNIKGPKGDRGEAGPTYTAGTGIDITNNVISATGGPAFSGDYNDLTNKPDLSVYAETADLATVATSGSYNDLTNKPDLSVYATTTALGTGLARKQDTLTAGTNITIDSNNVISAAGGSSLPTDPAADGTYFLSNTLSSGVSTKAWVSIPAAAGNNF